LRCAQFAAPSAGVDITGLRFTRLIRVEAVEKARRCDQEILKRIRNLRLAGRAPSAGPNLTIAVPGERVRIANAGLYEISMI
jgi:hypothetical protein